MITIPNIAGTVYGVIGLGKSGHATVMSLIASGAKVFAWDDKEATREAVKKQFPAVEIAPHESWNYAHFVALVMSPGIALSHPAVAAAQAHGVEVMGDIELLFQAQPDARYIGITGTNGKSTTTSLIGHILAECGERVAVGGNIGTPALALPPLGDDGIYVLELSSYQLDLLHTVKFDIAILLNISPDHLDHHGSMENYIAAKKHIFDRQGNKDVAIVGIDDAESAAIAEALKARAVQKVIPLSMTQFTPRGISLKDGVLQVILGAQQMQADLRNINALRGTHNAQNAAAAYAACWTIGCAHGDIMAAMDSYPGLAHRMQWLGQVGGVQFVNDSKATNADATEKALMTYDRIYWIAGGVAKEGGIAPLAPYFMKMRHAYLIGEAAADFARTLEGRVPYTMCGTLEKAFEAAAYAATYAPQGNAAVVLSPACASFDQFANFEARGDAFVKLFRAYQEKRGGAHGPAA